MADPVADLLRKTPIPDAIRAQAWDAFESAKDADELATALQAIKMPDVAKASLWDLKAQAAPPPQATVTQPQTQIAPNDEGVLTGLIKGAAKGAANTAIGLGQIVHEIPGVSRVVDAIYGTPGLSQASFPAARKAVEPTTTAQKIGYGAEQVGEFFTPTGVAGKLGKVVEVAKSVGLTQAQTGSPAAAAASGAITAVLPGAGAAQRAATSLEAGAGKTVARALGPTKEWAKEQAKKLAPEMIERGVKGSRPQMLAQASAKTAELSKGIKNAIDSAAGEGVEVSGDVVRGAIQAAREALTAVDANGTARVIPGTETVVKRLEKLDSFVTALGPDIPIDKAAQIRRVWDQIVSKAGLYGQKATASSTDAATAWATREAANAMRGVINKGSVDLAALNQEYSFWKGLKDVLKETERRTQAQSSGLTSTVLAGTGATIGAASGNSVSDRVQNAVLGGLAGKQLIKLLQSPAWATRVSAPLKIMLSDALASGSAARIEAATKTILRAIPAAYRPSEDTE